MLCEVAQQWLHNVLLPKIPTMCHGTYHVAQDVAWNTTCLEDQIKRQFLEAIYKVDAEGRAQAEQAIEDASEEQRLCQEIELEKIDQGISEAIYCLGWLSGVCKDQLGPNDFWQNWAARYESPGSTVPHCTPKLIHMLAAQYTFESVIDADRLD